MPHHPKEETTEGNLTDKVAKESKDSTASDHPIHHEDHDEASSGGKAKAADHHSKGPVINQEIGEPASKEELRKRAAELNN